MTVFDTFMKLYVDNLSLFTGESELRELFSPHGTVSEVHLATDRMSGQSRGFAFVTMGDGHEGQAAIDALEGQLVDGCNLTVKPFLARLVELNLL